MSEVKPYALDDLLLNKVSQRISLCGYSNAGLGIKAEAIGRQ